MTPLEIVIALAVIAGVIYLLIPRPRFKIHLGTPPRITGKPPAEFVETTLEVCQEFQLPHGWIAGFPAGRLTRLRFSKNIPPEVQQRLRNIWANAR